MCICSTDNQLLKSTFHLETLTDLCNLGYPDPSWLMQEKCSTLTTAQNPFKLPLTGNPSSANMLMSNVLIMSHHTFQYFRPLPNQEINTMHTTYEEERKWNTGSWFKWAPPAPRAQHPPPSWTVGGGGEEGINWEKNYLFIFINSWHHHHLASRKKGCFNLLGRIQFFREEIWGSDHE